MKTVIYLDYNYNIIEDLKFAKFKVEIESRHNFNSYSTNVQDLDGLTFKYKVVSYNCWNNKGYAEEDEDADYFYCDKWAYRQPYFYFEMYDVDGVLVECFGDDVLHQASIFKLVQSLFIKK